MAYTELSGNTGYIPDHEATGNLTIEFSRNVKSFPLNQYSELRPVKKSKGYYLRIKPEQSGRVIYDDGREYIFPDGSDRPTGTDNLEQFEFEKYQTRRFSNSVMLSNRAVEMAGWNVTQVEQRAKAQQAMTLRARKAAAALNGASWGANQANVDGAGGSLNGNSALLGSGHNWSNGTVANPYLKISLQAADLVILQGTLALIRPQDLVLVFSPDTAFAISQSQEIQSLLSNSVYALPLLQGTIPGSQRNYSLPPMLYDHRVAIEDTVYVSSRKGAATVTRAFTIPKGTAYLLARGENAFINPAIEAADAGELEMDEEARENTPVYSTLIGFFKEEMTSETFADVRNRRTEIAITSDYDYQVSQPLSGFQFQRTCG